MTPSQEAEARRLSAAQREVLRRASQPSPALVCRGQLRAARWLAGRGYVAIVPTLRGNRVLLSDLGREALELEFESSK